MLPTKKLAAGLAAGLDLLKETGGSVVKYTPKNSNDEPLATLIVVYGKKETADVLKAVEAAEEKW